jgi:hypothetical protein
MRDKKTWAASGLSVHYHKMDKDPQKFQSIPGDYPRSTRAQSTGIKSQNLYYYPPTKGKTQHRCRPAAGAIDRIAKVAG